MQRGSFWPGKAPGAPCASQLIADPSYAMRLMLDTVLLLLSPLHVTLIAPLLHPALMRVAGLS
jgi:hypothetical protein